MREIGVEIGGDGIAVVTLNRPEKRNAVTLAMWRRLADIFKSLEADQAVRVVILTGAGGHFSAGADISEFAAVRSSEADGRLYDEASDGAEDALHDLAKPTVAAIDGVCVGGGLGLALACDFRIAAAGARFGITAARLGIVYGLPETRKLVNVVGASAAKRILYLADIFGTDEAMRLGLLQEVTDGPALGAATSFARRMTANAPLSLAGAKRVIGALMAGSDEAEAAAIEGVVLAALASDDYREGQRAFAEKRPPKFSGR